MPRTLELLAALIGLVIAAPIILLLATLIRLKSPGPGLFRQIRVGRGGAHFICYKLRTMADEAPNVPTHLAPGMHVTPIGRVLRATKLDELPQLFNVVVGEMSFVGPRPCLPSQTELIHEREARGVLLIRPGITGLAQIQGIDMSDPVRLAKVDAEYAAQRSLALDLQIILKTVLGGAGRGDRIQS